MELERQWRAALIVVEEISKIGVPGEAETDGGVLRERGGGERQPLRPDSRPR